MIEAPVQTEELTLRITQEIRVRASLAITFTALLEQLGPGNEHPDGTPMPLVIEPWPGGRWFRDLGDNNGHFWGNVQSIKRPHLLEMTGPLFMSNPVTNNVQYRLSEEAGETVLRFSHTGFGVIPDEIRKNLNKGWGFIHEQVRTYAEGTRA